MARTLALCTLLALTGASSAGATEDRPTVIMLELPKITPNNEDLYKAVLAQLSAAPLRLNRLTVDDTQFFTDAPLQSADRLSKSLGATLLFWVTEEETGSTVFFYDNRLPKPRIQERRLSLVSDSESSRFETVANAVASIVEETVIRRRKPVVRPVPPEPAPPPPTKPAPVRRWMELFAAYSGALFSSETVVHGVQMGLGFLPSEHIAVTMSYIHTLPLRIGTDAYQMTLTPRSIEATLAARLHVRTVDFRLGVAWRVDLRTFDLESRSESIRPRRDDLEAIHSLCPFADLRWTYRQRFGLTAGVGVNIAANERIYSIRRTVDDSNIDLLRPYIAKLTFRIGLVLQL